MIPEAAVEAALISAYGNPRKGNEALWKAMRATLEAASPHLHLAELLAGVQREIDDTKTMADVLIEHQRHKGGCLCGWAKLGHSHPEHQAEALSAAGFGLVTK